MTAFGDFLTLWMVKHHVQQSELAENTGIPASIISRWMNVRRASRPSPESLDKLAPVMGVPVEELMRVAGYLPGEPNIESGRRPPIMARMRSLELEEARWVEVMGPRLGEDQAIRLFWDGLTRDARRRNDDVVTALTASAAELAEDDDAANKPVAFFEAFEDAAREAVAA